MLKARNTIGLRDFQQHKPGKLEKTDLLEVYSDNDKKNLQQNVTNINWNVFKKIPLPLYSQGYTQITRTIVHCSESMDT